MNSSSWLYPEKNFDNVSNFSLLKFQEIFQNEKKKRNSLDTLIIQTLKYLMTIKKGNFLSKTLLSTTNKYSIQLFVNGMWRTYPIQADTSSSSSTTQYFQLTKTQSQAQLDSDSLLDNILSIIKSQISSTSSKIVNELLFLISGSPVYSILFSNPVFEKESQNCWENIQQNLNNSFIGLVYQNKSTSDIPSFDLLNVFQFEEIENPAIKKSQKIICVDDQMNYFGENKNIKEKHNEILSLLNQSDVFVTSSTTQNSIWLEWDLISELFVQIVVCTDQQNAAFSNFEDKFNFNEWFGENCYEIDTSDCKPITGMVSYNNNNNSNNNNEKSTSQSDNDSEIDISFLILEIKYLIDNEEKNMNKFEILSINNLFLSAKSKISYFEVDFSSIIKAKQREISHSFFILPFSASRANNNNNTTFKLSFNLKFYFQTNFVKIRTRRNLPNLLIENLQKFINNSNKLNFFDKFSIFPFPETCIKLIQSINGGCLGLFVNNSNSKLAIQYSVQNVYEENIFDPQSFIIHYINPNSQKIISSLSTFKNEFNFLIDVIEIKSFDNNNNDNNNGNRNNNDLNTFDDSNENDLFSEKLITEDFKINQKNKISNKMYNNRTSSSGSFNIDSFENNNISSHDWQTAIKIQNQEQSSALFLINDSNGATCPICITDLEVGQGIKLKNCGDTYCFSCLKLYIISQMSIGVFNIQCPLPKCKARLDLQEIRVTIGETEFQNFDKRTFEQFAASGAEYYCCPTPDCNYYVSWEEENGIPRLQCPTCLKESCILCQSTPYHHDKTCQEYRDSLKQKDDNMKDEDATLKFLNEGKYRKCAKCGIFVEKIEGCDKMKCRCGYAFCYVCGTEGATCGCTPAEHGFWDNNTGRADFDTSRKYNAKKGNYR